MLRVRWPPAYPAEAPHLELSCPGAAAAALAVAGTELRALAAAAACGEGEECGAALAQRFVDLAADELKPPPLAASSSSSSAAAAAASDDALEEAVVRIDHMVSVGVRVRFGGIGCFNTKDSTRFRVRASTTYMPLTCPDPNSHPRPNP